MTCFALVLAWFEKIDCRVFFLKKILFISSLYPNPFDMRVAPFNKQQLSSLSKYYLIDVISPIPWISKKNNSSRCNWVDEGDVRCFFPTFYYPPRIARCFHGDFYYYSIIGLVNRLARENNYELIFSSWLYPDVWAAQKVADKLKLPFFFKVHGTDVNRLDRGSLFAKKSLSAVIQSSGVVCVSRALKNRLVDFGCNGSKIHVLYNGINKEIFHPADKFLLKGEMQIKKGSKLILYVGRLEKEKGIFELLDAFKEMSKDNINNLRLNIIGEGSCIGSINKYLTDNKLLNIVGMMGFLPLPDVAKWMNVSDVLCLPSYMEGVPNVVLEALACGTRVVTTNVGGLPEIAAQDNRVILVKPRDSEGLRSGLIDALGVSTNDIKAINLGTWDQNASQLANLFGYEGEG